MVSTATMKRGKLMKLNLYSPKAKKVSLGGDFNNWDSRVLSAKKDSNGNWMVKVSLKPGRYEYKFFVDGSWVTDPRCQTRVFNSYGTENCVLEVK